MPTSVLIVDDEEAVCWALAEAFRAEGYSVRTAATAEQALDQARRHRPDAVVLDVRLPGMDGLAALGRLRALTADAPVVVITAHGNLGTAVAAVEGGAFDYLPKPFDLDQALAAVRRAVERRPAPPGPPPPAPPGDEIVGRSPAMQDVFKRIALVAGHDACVLITGESGTGKELVARAVHRHSGRRDRPFLPVHVAALNPNLVESELFGHVKGAFTGAAEDRPGLLALADGGTAFLDELADIPPGVQAKLLRVLEQGEVLPVGSTRPRPIDVRLLAATHADLGRRIAAGEFRHDLFFRLNVFPIRLPPLRERAGDVALLAEHFLRRLAPRSWPLPASTLAELERRPWPGNVRELRNALEHAAIVAHGGPVLPEHLPPAGDAAPDPAGHLADAVRRWVGERVAAAGVAEPAGLYAGLVEAAERPLLEEVLRRTEGNRLAAARWLGLARATVRKLLRRHLPGSAGDDPGGE